MGFRSTIKELFLKSNLNSVRRGAFERCSVTLFAALAISAAGSVGAQTAPAPPAANGAAGSARPTLSAPPAGASRTGGTPAGATAGEPGNDAAARDRGAESAPANLSSSPESAPEIMLDVTPQTTPDAAESGRGERMP